MLQQSPESLLKVMFRAAVMSAAPSSCIPSFLPPVPKGKTVIVGAGKASAAMAHSLEEEWNGTLKGLVVTRYGHAITCNRISVVEAAHPIPDAAGMSAALQIKELVSDLTSDDLVICLLSGGGSALLPLPGTGLTLNDKREINSALLASGATIAEMNCVRKHLSAIKGGRLTLAAYPARVVTLAISDVPGDDPEVIASGPTVPDSTTVGQAQGILDKFNLTFPAASRFFAQAEAETPKPSHPAFNRTSYHLIATPGQALRAAAEVARASRIIPQMLGDAIEGEARQVAVQHAEHVRRILQRTRPRETPCVLLSGGETTVTLRGRGRGGRNTEYLLALGLALEDIGTIYALAADTDGIDGSEDNAGAVLTPKTLNDARAKGLDPKAALEDNDSYSIFSQTNSLVVTGPTLTNVNDFRAILIY